MLIYDVFEINKFFPLNIINIINIGHLRVIRNSKFQKVSRA